jgi:hypothetical protein
MIDRPRNLLTFLAAHLGMESRLHAATQVTHEPRYPTGSAMQVGLAWHITALSSLLPNHRAIPGESCWLRAPQPVSAGARARQRSDSRWPNRDIEITALGGRFLLS